MPGFLYNLIGGSDNAPSLEGSDSTSFTSGDSESKRLRSNSNLIYFNTQLLAAADKKFQENSAKNFVYADKRFQENSANKLQFGDRKQSCVSSIQGGKTDTKLQKITKLRKNTSNKLINTDKLLKLLKCDMKYDQLFSLVFSLVSLALIIMSMANTNWVKRESLGVRYSRGLWQVCQSKWGTLTPGSLPSGDDGEEIPPDKSVQLDSDGNPATFSEPTKHDVKMECRSYRNQPRWLYVVQTLYVLVLISSLLGCSAAFFMARIPHKVSGKHASLLLLGVISWLLIALAMFGQMNLWTKIKNVQDCYSYGPGIVLAWFSLVASVIGLALALISSIACGTATSEEDGVTAAVI